MKTLLSLLAFLPLLLLSLNSCADKSAISTVDIPRDTIFLHHDEAPKTNFPEDWIGVYEGEMEWYSNGRLNAKIPLRVEVYKVDSLENTWGWRSTYDSTEAVPYEVVKDYLVIQKDTSIEHKYVMDEQNGILLDMNLIDNTFYTSFEVASNRILSTNKLIHDKLYHELIMSPVTKNRETFATEGQDTFFVDGMQEVVIQKAILSLKK